MKDMDSKSNFSMKSASALVLLHPEMEELECVAPVDLLRRAGVEVQLIQLTHSLKHPWIKGKNGIRIVAEKSLPQIKLDNFDLLMIPGGPGVTQLRKDPRVINGVQAFANEGRWLACICAAPLLLHDAGLLTGKHYTAHPTTTSELINRDSLLPVVIDGHLITAAGAGAAIPFGLSMISCLLDRKIAEKVAQAIEFYGDFPS